MLIVNTDPVVPAKGKSEWLVCCYRSIAAIRNDQEPNTPHVSTSSDSSTQVIRRPAVSVAAMGMIAFVRRCGYRTHARTHRFSHRQVLGDGSKLALQPSRICHPSYVTLCLEPTIWLHTSTPKDAFFYIAIDTSSLQSRGG